LSQTLSLAERVLHIALDHKAEEPVVLDMKGLSSEAEAFVIVTAQNRQHAHAIADYVRDDLRKEGLRPVSVEGEEAARWICLDYGSVWLHVFTADLRDYYDLEGLWSDAPRVPLKAELAQPA